jgi:hypothetical protein
VAAGFLYKFSAPSFIFKTFPLEKDSPFHSTLLLKTIKGETHENCILYQYTLSRERFSPIENYLIQIDIGFHFHCSLEKKKLPFQLESDGNVCASKLLCIQFL